MISLLPHAELLLNIIFNGIIGVYICSGTIKDPFKRFTAPRLSGSIAFRLQNVTHQSLVLYWVSHAEIFVFSTKNFDCLYIVINIGRQQLHYLLNTFSLKLENVVDDNLYRTYIRVHTNFTFKSDTDSKLRSLWCYPITHLCSIIYSQVYHYNCFYDYSQLLSELSFSFANLLFSPVHHQSIQITQMYMAYNNTNNTKKHEIRTNW